MSLLPAERRFCRFPRCRLFVLFALSCLIGPLGCQQLFYDENAPFRKETVGLAVTVPETPPPASKPLVQEPVSTLAAPAKTSPLHPRLLPRQEPAEPASTPLIAPSATVADARRVALRADTVLSARTITEDTTLRGVVLVQGSLVVAPQATLRLEPGTSLLFKRPAQAVQNPRLVVQGRLVCGGTAQRPVVIGAAFSDAQPADWGGILFLSSEKKNSLDHCRIEGAETGIEARYSQFVARGLELTRSRQGVTLYDSVATLQGATVSGCDSGLFAADSELELTNVTLRKNRQGASSLHSSLVVTDCQFRGNSQEGLQAEQCRYRLSGCRASDNRTGVVLKGGDGQVQQCRFALNREAGLTVAGGRIKITYSSFQDNLGVGLWLDGARGSVTQSSFSLNREGNLYNSGTDSFAAVLNWWGTTNEARIAEGIRDAGRSAGSSQVSFEPFLTVRPALAP